MAILQHHVRIVVRGTVLGQMFNNVYYYAAASASTFNYAEIAQAFWTDIGAAYRAACSDSVVFQRIDAYDNDNPDGDFGSYVIPTGANTGTLSGVDLGPMFAAALTLGVANRSTKPGSKRIPGVCAASVGEGGYLLGPYLTLLNTLATGLLNGFLFGLLDAGHANPIIYGAPHPATAHTPARPTAVYQDVTSITVKPVVTTQNSRKYGHGA